MNNKICFVVDIKQIFELFDAGLEDEGEVKDEPEKDESKSEKEENQEKKTGGYKISI